MYVLGRQTIIAIGANPDPRLDCAISLEGSTAPAVNTAPFAITLRYILDKAIVKPTSFSRYLKALTSIKWSLLEELAVALLNYANDEVVARWLRVSLLTPTNQGLRTYTVMLEDSQPKRDSPRIHSRLSKL